MTRLTYWGEPTGASGASKAMVVSAIALAGPVTISRLDPNSAATMQGSTAAANPCCGGSPASVANARAWGSTTTAPVRPASRSARRAPGWRHSSRHRITGSCTQRVRVLRVEGDVAPEKRCNRALQGAPILG